MEIKVRIKTPNGQATKTYKKIKPFMRLDTCEHEAYTNEEDNEMMWIIRGDIRRVMKIQRNIGVFHNIMTKVMDNKQIKGIIRKEDYNDLKDMLEDNTSIEIIKAAEEKELSDYNKTWIQKIKEKFKKIVT